MINRTQILPLLLAPILAVAAWLAATSSADQPVAQEQSLAQAAAPAAENGEDPRLQDATLPPQHDPLPGSTWFPMELGGKTIEVQVAVTDEEIQRGLMQRDELGEHHGMLFVIRRPGQQSFWMLETPLPLDIAYFSTDGILREIYPMEPLSLESVPSQRDDIRYALEMNQGWFASNHVEPGVALDFDWLTDVLQRRGFDPETFVLRPTDPEPSAVGEVAAGFDAATVLGLLEAGFPPAEVLTELQREGYRGATDIATLTVLRQAGADIPLLGWLLRNARTP